MAKKPEKKPKKAPKPIKKNNAGKGALTVKKSKPKSSRDDEEE